MQNDSKDRPRSSEAGNPGNCTYCSATKPMVANMPRMYSVHSKWRPRRIRGRASALPRVATSRRRCRRSPADRTPPRRPPSRPSSRASARRAGSYCCWQRASSCLRGCPGCCHRRRQPWRPPLEQPQRSPRRQRRATSPHESPKDDLRTCSSPLFLALLREHAHRRDAAEGQHGQTAVPQLLRQPFECLKCSPHPCLDLHVVLPLGIQRVEAPEPEVTRLAIRLALLARRSIHVSSAFRTLPAC